MKINIKSRMYGNAIKTQMKEKNYKAIKWLETKEDCEERNYLIDYLKQINMKV